MPVENVKELIKIRIADRSDPAVYTFTAVFTVEVLGKYILSGLAQMASVN